MGSPKRRASLILLLLLPLSLAVPVGLNASSDAQEVSASHRTTSSMPNPGRGDEENFENLGFRFDQLISSLNTGDKPVKILSTRVCDEFFELQMKEVKVVGYYRNLSKKVIYVVVSGNGAQFQACVVSIIKLANSNNKAALSKIVARFTTSLHGKAGPEEYFQQGGIRYHLQNISGVPTFHCTNAKADDRAIIRAQPG